MASGQPAVRRSCGESLKIERSGIRAAQLTDGRGPEVLRAVVVLRPPQAGQQPASWRAAQVLHKKHKESDYPTDAQADVARR